MAVQQSYFLTVQGASTKTVWKQQVKKLHINNFINRIFLVNFMYINYILYSNSTNRQATIREFNINVDEDMFHILESLN